MRKSLFFRLFSGYLLIVLVISIFIPALSFKIIRTHYINTLSANLRNLGGSLILGVSPLLEEGRFNELDSLVKKMGGQIDTRITVVDPEGVVLADSEKDPESMENHRNRPEVIEALKGSFGTSLRLSTTVGEEMLYVALPIQSHGTILGILRVSLFLTSINGLLNDLKMNILYVTTVIIIICLLGAGLFSRSLSRPIGQLASLSHRVASGDFNTKAFLKNGGELEELADSFNHMTEQIKTLFAELSSRKEELDSIISSLQEGLLLLDEKGKILLSNESFDTIVQQDSVQGHFYWEVVRETAFAELVKKVRDEKRSFAREVVLNDRIFLCSGTPLESRQEIIVVLHDITQAKNLEKMKKDFVVNVSHELRTPLTAIKAFVETLEEEIDGKKRHYVDVIKRHTDRLINIVGDLLLLSELEGKGTKLEIEEVKVKNLIENIVPMFQPRLREKHLDLKLEVENNLPLIRADRFKLEQMFINLIDNAIKYADQGEIRISARKTNNNIRLEIEDTGIGIPEEQLPRIFERFYVVDKSRSRKFGGTGLGLSIVKHIVLLHDGSIDVESSLGSGTRFSVTLPINPLQV